MGQKTHPHGLRVGIHRKWNYSWYGVGVEGKNLFFQQRAIEEIFKLWMSLYVYTRISSVKRLLLVDLKLYKEGLYNFFIFVFFYKFRTKRRRQKQKKIKKNTRRFKKY